MADDSTLYTCNSIESAQSLLESALIIGQSPALIIFDHADHATDKNLAFISASIVIGFSLITSQPSSIARQP